MTQRVNHHQTSLAAQRAYLEALRADGCAPSNQLRPDFDGLESTIQLIEEVARKSNGNVRAIDRTISTLSGKIPALAALLDVQRGCSRRSLPGVCMSRFPNGCIPP